MFPFIEEGYRATMGRKLPQSIQECGHEIRTFTPKWGNINERRNQLHEVIRLSGMNLIINETDHPLIIKVASIPSAKMQIYFIDNDDYFMKRGTLADKEGKEYEDNAERAIFFARGVLETVHKLRWMPDIIHCHGWAAAFAPMFLKLAYKEEPSYANSKVVVSVLPKEFELDLGTEAPKSVEWKDVHYSDIEEHCAKGFTHTDLMKVATKYADGVILEGDDTDPAVEEYAKSIGLPVLRSTGDDFKDKYSEFYESLMD